MVGFALISFCCVVLCTPANEVSPGTFEHTQDEVSSKACHLVFDKFLLTS